MTDLEAGRPATAGTIHEIGSLSRTFAAATGMQLVESEPQAPKAPRNGSNSNLQAPPDHPGYGKVMAIDTQALGELDVQDATGAAVRVGSAWAKGFRQGATQGDPWQQGGVLVVRAGGEAVLCFASEEAGDLAPTAEVMAAARRAAQA